MRRNRVTIRWTTFDPGTGVVQYSADGLEFKTVEAKTREFTVEETGQTYAYFRHEAVITGLTPGTEYQYKVTHEGLPLAPDEELVFRTIGTLPFQFLVVGDSGTGSAEQRMLAQRMQRERPKFLIHTGDLVYPTGNFETYERNYFDFYRTMMKKVPFFPALGNHDYYEMRGVPYVTVHDLPTEDVRESDHGRYFSFDWGNAHIICLDTNTPLEQAVARRGDMLAWLRRDLERTRKYWRIVYFHHPPYGSGPNQTDPLTKMAREHIVPILEEYDIPLVFNGHEHSYQRSHPIRRGQINRTQGTVYFVSGGGGANLYPVYPSANLASGASVYHYLRCDTDGPEMAIRAVNENGEVFDQTRIAPRPVLWKQRAVLNAASSEPAIAAGGVVSIFGWQLAPEELSSDKLPLPKELANMKVSLNDEPLPVLSVAPTQINVQLPFDAAGTATLRVSGPNGSVQAEIHIFDVAPALFTAAAFRADGTPISDDAPALRGETTILYATGLGAVEGEVAAGDAITTRPAVRATVAVVVDGWTLAAESATLADNLPGVYKIVFTLPAEHPTGRADLRITANGMPSNAVRVPIA